MSCWPAVPRKRWRSCRNTPEKLISSSPTSACPGSTASAHHQGRELKPGLKAVLSSGYLDGTLKTRMAEQGVEGFLSKPYEINTLLHTVRGVLDKKHV